ncbi:MAG: ABC transporter permease [Sphingobacteriales bacterium]|jgi:lipopolysaccharide transport system permease protein|nr:MAG: ABC transporter permease [Sphingobacteriales bacterium]
MSKEISSNTWEIIISSKRGLFEINFTQLFQYSDLLKMFLIRDIAVNYKQTVLGPLWFIAQPIMTTIIYVFVFGNIANLSTDGIPKPLFYLCGIIIWNYFSDCFIRTSDTFSQNADIYGKVYFPRLISPISVVISNTLKFFIQLLLFITIYMYLILSNDYNLQIQVSIVFLPLLIFLMSLLGLGFGLIFSSLTTKYKDLKFLIQFGVQLLMYATPVIYPLSSIPDKYKFYFKLNPITYIIEAFKYSFFGTGQTNVGGLIYSSVIIIFILFLGILIFNKTEKSFMDTI